MRSSSIAILLFLSSTGCISSRTPHENFIDGAMNGMIGRDIRNNLDYEKFARHQLPNGSIEFRISKIMVRGGDPCTLIYEVDPRSYLVLHSSYVGSDKDCVIPP